MKPPRRPHTSAGPKDTSNLLYHPEFEFKERSIDPDDRIFPLPKRAPPVPPGLWDPVQTPTVIRNEGNNHIIFQPISLDHVRDWEEELARIELKSRRRSAGMLGFRKR